MYLQRIYFNCFWRKDLASTFGNCNENHLTSRPLLWHCIKEKFASVISLITLFLTALFFLLAPLLSKFYCLALMFVWFFWTYIYIIGFCVKRIRKQWKKQHEKKEKQWENNRTHYKKQEENHREPKGKQWKTENNRKTIRNKKQNIGINLKYRKLEENCWKQ